MSSRPIIAAYYFPNYHADARNELFHGKNWTEWKLVKEARPRDASHRQPLIPAWGYEDEADPIAMGRKIDAAASNGVDAFIFDWYYYDDGPFLHRALDEGFLRAGNNDKIKFSCMWANHDWVDIHPAELGKTPSLLYPGVVRPDTFEKVTDLVIERYFSHPSHLTFEGAPYFSIYELTKLIQSFGSIGKTRKALDRFRYKARRAGHADIHLNLICTDNAILPGETVSHDPFRLAEELGFSSMGSYIWVHHFSMAGNESLEYGAAKAAYLDFYLKQRNSSDLPFFPNVTMGWDPNARTLQSKDWSAGNYPYTTYLKNNDPMAFREALQDVAVRQREESKAGLITINAWNEWTEGSYLEPDTFYGMGYLNAIRDVFGCREA